MKSSKLLLDMYEKKMFTDIQLILIDDSESIVMHLHRSILYISESEYFRALLTNFNSRDKPIITLNVPNAKECHDIIESFYGKTHEINDLKRAIDSYRCRQYFCLNFDLDDILCWCKMDSKEMTNELYNEWLNALDTLGCKWLEEDIDIVFMRIPQNYDMNELPDFIIRSVTQIINNMLNDRFTKNNDQIELPRNFIKAAKIIQEKISSEQSDIIMMLFKNGIYYGETSKPDVFLIFSRYIKYYFGNSSIISDVDVKNVIRTWHNNNKTSIQ